MVMALVLFFGGCSRINLADPSPLLSGGRLSVEVSASSGLNQGQPLAFDLLVVYDERLLETLEEMDAATWFKNRKQFLADQSRKKNVEAHHWEWVPGQPKLMLELHFKRHARGGVAFANYFSVGAHRSHFDPFKDLLVNLGGKGFALVQ